MKCNIVHRENNKGVDYWCLSHKSLAKSINGEVPLECECQYKERFNYITDLSKNEVINLKIVYPNLRKNAELKVYINNEEFMGILKIENSVFDIKDYGGIMLSKLNGITLEASVCPKCGGNHSDNGKFAYTPHSTHLCVYCGCLFKVEKENIGNELALYFNFPDIILEENICDITDGCKIEYDMFNGVLKVNGIICNKVKIENEEFELVEYLNRSLANEF